VKFQLTVNIDSDPLNHVNDVLGAMHEVSMDLEDLRGEPLPPTGTVKYPLGKDRATWTFRAPLAAGSSFPLDQQAIFTANAMDNMATALREHANDLRASSPGEPNFTAREACTVLAALRCFQEIVAAAKPGFNKDVIFNASAVIAMEHFEDAEPLTLDEIDSLCERINVEWTSPFDRIRRCLKCNETYLLPTDGDPHRCPKEDADATV
jgi:hypothetical protein